MGTSSEQHYSLRWNDYTVKIVTAFQSLRDEEDFVDVTVACDGHHYSAHKMVLSACSPYFRSLLRANPCQHPIVILKDVGHIEMERLLEFMYNGEVNIAQDQLAAFLKTAESLKIRGLAGTSDDLEQSQGRDIHNFSGGTGTVGISGRNSPSGGFNSSQECKDDDITTDGIFHTNSPSTKRRKRGSDAPTVSQADNSSSQTTDNLSGEGLMESSSDRVTMSGDHSIDLEDERMDSNSRRELKSEPSDSLGEVYVESSDIALAGPSGSSSSLNNQDGIPSSDNAAAPQSAVCEALNLSLRPSPAIPQLNGSASFPASVSIQGLSTERPLYPPHNLLQTPSNNAVTLLPHPLHHQFKREDNFEEENGHPDIVLRGGPAPVETHVYAASDAAMDLVSISEKKPFADVDFDGGRAPPSFAERVVSVAAPTTTPATTPATYKSSKIYPCQECYKVFRHPMSLHHHRHVHKGTYTCHSCGKVFSRRWDLHRHIHRSKMGCRRPNHNFSPPSNTITTSSTASSTTTTFMNTTTAAASMPNSHGLVTGPPLHHSENHQHHHPPYDLNNLPSN